MKDVLVSVIVPVYNTGKYLKKCLDSVLAQTLRDIEVICINDGSTDNSAEILKNYEQKDKRISIVDQKHEGASLARNKAMALARGEFIAFIDSDDWWPNLDSLTILYNNAKKNKVKISGGSFSEYDSRNGNIIDDYSGRGHLEAYQFFCDGVIQYKDWQSDLGWIRFIYDRKFLIDNGIEFPNLTRHEDPVFLVRAMMLAKNFYATKEVVYRYRIFYKKDGLSQKNIDDAILGLAMNIVVAQKNSLDVLKKWCYETFYWYITLSPDYRKRTIELDNLKHDLEIERRKNADLTKCLASTKDELELKRREAAYANQEIRRIFDSGAYKIGRKITYPIRIVRKLRSNNNGK